MGNTGDYSTIIIIKKNFVATTGAHLQTVTLTAPNSENSRNHKLIYRRRKQTSDAQPREGRQGEQGGYGGKAFVHCLYCGYGFWGGPMLKLIILTPKYMQFALHHLRAQEARKDGDGRKPAVKGLGGTQ